MRVYERFQATVNRLLDGSFPGSKLSSFEILDEQSSLSPSPNSVKENVTDRLILRIPYAGHSLVWEVRFNISDPEMAPDFVFDDESFSLLFLDVDIISDNVPSLLNWNVDDPDCLSKVVQQLLIFYTKYQLETLRESDVWSLIGKEMEKLMSDLDIQTHQIQVLQWESQLIPQFSSCATRPARDTVSILLLNLSANLESILIAEEFQEFSLHFILQEYATPSVIFHLNPVLQMLLSDKGDIVIPNYPRNQGLFSYVKIFKELILNSLKMVESDICKCDDFHNSLSLALTEQRKKNSDFDFQILETSSLDCNSQSYLLKHDWFSVILQVETRQCSGKPKVLLRSITSGIPKEIELEASKAWDPHEILNHVLEKIKLFKDKVCGSINRQSISSGNIK